MPPLSISEISERTLPDLSNLDAAALRRLFEVKVGPLKTDADLDECFNNVTWLWPGFIPNGFPTALIGPCGAEKSAVALSLCKTLLQGGTWPDGTRCEPIPPDLHLLWIDTEGTLPLFHHRLHQWGIPRERFLFSRQPLHSFNIDDEQDFGWLRSITNLSLPPLIIVNSLCDAHTRGENRAAMRGVMRRLASLAAANDTAVLVIHHLDKSASLSMRYPLSFTRIKGISPVMQHCASILALGVPDFNRPEAHRLDVVRASLIEPPAPLNCAVTPDGLEWSPAPDTPPGPPTASERAVHFLSQALVNGPRPSAELMREAAELKIGMKSFYQARKFLNLELFREGGSKGKWYVAPPGQTHSTTFTNIAN